MMAPMSQTARRATTLYLNPKIAKAAKIKAAITGKSLSTLANEGLALILREDEQLIRLARARSRQPARDYEEFIKELRRDGLI